MTEAKTKGSGAAAKVLMPVVATLASAVASYLAKKAPQYLEESVLPKLREAKESTGDAAGAGPSTDREGSKTGPTNDDLERRRRERAEHRAARRKAS